MRRAVLTVFLACAATLAGCSTMVKTPGTEGLWSASLAELTATSEVGGRNYDEYAVIGIGIDGRSYPLKEEKTTFLLTAGRHEVVFSYSRTPRGPSEKNPRYFFVAEPGGRYALASTYSSAGLFHRIQTPDHQDVLKRE